MLLDDAPVRGGRRVRMLRAVRVLPLKLLPLLALDLLVTVATFLLGASSVPAP